MSTIITQKGHNHRSCNQKRNYKAELATLSRFIQVYCRKKHNSKPEQLCASCQDLLDYATSRLKKCPYNPKPKCKDCPSHCYKDEYRSKIREVMKFSGIYFVKRGRLDWLIKYFMK